MVWHVVHARVCCGDFGKNLESGECPAKHRASRPPPSLPPIVGPTQAPTTWSTAPLPAHRTSISQRGVYTPAGCSLGKKRHEGLAEQVGEVVGG